MTRITPRNQRPPHKFQSLERTHACGGECACGWVSVIRKVIVVENVKIAIGSWVRDGWAAGTNR